MDKLLNKGLIECDVSNQLFMLGASADALGGSNELRLEEHKLVVASFELEVLAHHVGQVRSDLDLHGLRHRANSQVIGRKVLLDVLVGLFRGRRGKVIICVLHLGLLSLLHNHVLKLLVNELAQV